MSHETGSGEWSSSTCVWLPGLAEWPSLMCLSVVLCTGAVNIKLGSLCRPVCLPLCLTSICWPWKSKTRINIRLLGCAKKPWDIGLVHSVAFGWFRRHEPLGQKNNLVTAGPGIASTGLCHTPGYWGRHCFSNSWEGHPRKHTCSSPHSIFQPGGWSRWRDDNLFL